MTHAFILWALLERFFHAATLFPSTKALSVNVNDAKVTMKQRRED